jgi:hypothetical protein
MGFTHLQIEWNPWLGGYRPQISVLSALCPQLNLLTPLEKNSWRIPPRKKLMGTPLHHFNDYATFTLHCIVRILHACKSCHCSLD